MDKSEKAWKGLPAFRKLCAGLLLWLLLGPVSAATELRIVHCWMGCPRGAGADNHLLLRPIYALSYNTSTKSADWVAYRITSGTVGIASNLSRQPRSDEQVSDTLAVTDFRSTAYPDLSRASYAPLVNFAGTPYWDDVNYLTNAVARRNGLSQGAWYGLEWAVRNLVNQAQELYVVTGPVFAAQGANIQLQTSKAHRVPDGFFKIVVTPEGESAAFLFEQSARVGTHHCSLQVSIEEVEQATGLSFFPDAQVRPRPGLAARLGCF